MNKNTLLLYIEEIRKYLVGLPDGDREADRQAALATTDALLDFLDESD